jgi:uncharacterized protein YdiU (UPF0061 family)
MAGLESLHFVNRFTRELPGDPDAGQARRQVFGACWSAVAPTAVAAPRLLAHAREVASLLDLEVATPAEEQAFAQVFGGNRLLPGMEPFAMCYGGHQFGHWAGQLGDGRAINLGEVETSRGGHWTLQLKGAGPTPYSRTADGLAVLRSSIREFLCSEAMHHLGVPTTRALSLVTTGEQVVRDMFYDGRARPEPGAVVCRVAPSFVRFGNFQIFTARQELSPLRQLADFVLRTDFAPLAPREGPAGPDEYAAMFAEVCRRTAALLVHWMRVGFVHGVMNTDNMSILGLSIDYGPYGWLEEVDPDWTPNTTDAEGRRYRFIAQPEIAHWNLLQLAQALFPLVGNSPPLEAGLDAYAAEFRSGYRRMTAEKLGIVPAAETADEPLVAELWPLLARSAIDMTLFFRNLAALPCETPQPFPPEHLLRFLEEGFYPADAGAAASRGDLAAWLARYRDRVRAEGTPDRVRRERMDRVNPLYVPRNYLAQLAIDKAEAGDPAMIAEMLEVSRRPYEQQPGREQYAAKRPEWARHRPGCSMLSCSS